MKAEISATLTGPCGSGKNFTFAFLLLLIFYNCGDICVGGASSRFRHSWLVERTGKWAEPDYAAMVYPKFACGAGYVLSSDLVHWLADNSHVLGAYQVN